MVTLSLVPRPFPRNFLLLVDMILKPSFPCLTARVSHLPLRSSPYARCYVNRPRTQSRILPKLPSRSASQWRARPPPRRPQYARFKAPKPPYQRLLNEPAFRYALGITGVGVGIFYVSNLEEVPVSGRRRFNFISPKFEEWISAGSFEQVTKEYRGSILPPDHPYSVKVNNVLRRLIPASGLEHLNWEVRVIDDPEQQNAFVMSGGKVFVFTGILPICADDDGLAAVLGHEISHQLAHHVSESISKSVPQLLIAAGLWISGVFWQVDTQLPLLFVDLVLKKPASRTMEVLLSRFQVVIEGCPC